MNVSMNYKYYRRDRRDVSEGIDDNKTNAPKNVIYLIISIF